MPAKFYEHEIESGLKHKRRLSTFIDSLIRMYLTDVKIVGITYVFCTDSFLLEMNKNFLGHDAYTDIISFDLSESKTELQAEIYISIDRVKDNAKQYHTPYTDELHRVIFHGVLHLCGFKDKNEKDRKIMRENEDYCLQHYKKELA